MVDENNQNNNKNNHKVEIIDLENGIYKVRYEIYQIGVYEINCSFGVKSKENKNEKKMIPIYGSPFIVTFSDKTIDPTKTTVEDTSPEFQFDQNKFVKPKFYLGVKTIFAIVPRDKYGLPISLDKPLDFTLKVSIPQKNEPVFLPSSKILTNFDKKSGGVHCIKLLTTQLGTYNIAFSYKDINLFNSPWEINTISSDLSPSPPRTEIRGFDLKKPIKVGEKVSLLLILKNKKGERINSGGDKIDCLIQHFVTGDTVDYVVKNVANSSKYVIEFTISIEGIYNLLINVNKLEISTFPYQIRAVLK